jgi:hypothetical protein
MVKSLKDFLNEENPKYDEKDVELGRKQPGDVKKSTMYVKRPNGKVKKINFKDDGMKYTKKGKFKSICKFANDPSSALYQDCKAWGDNIDANDKSKQ